jgi:hypothetical protein
LRRWATNPAAHALGRSSAARFLFSSPSAARNVQRRPIIAMVTFAEQPRALRDMNGFTIRHESLRPAGMRQPDARWSAPVGALAEGMYSFERDRQVSGRKPRFTTGAGIEEGGRIS